MARWDGKRRFSESRLNSDIQFYIDTSLRKEVDIKVTSIVEFIIGILGRIISGLFTTYIVRLIDRFTHKNNRHE